MSVEKIDFSYVSQEKKTFTTHLNLVLQNLRSPEALGIWAYLSSLPEGWNVNKSHLRKHFNMGRDKLDSTLRYLVDNKLIEVGQERLATGVMGKGYIYVRCGYNFKEDCKINEQSYPQKQPHTDLPLTAQPDTAKPGPGESAPINKTIYTNKEKERESTVRAKRVPLSEKISENFKPDQEREAKSKTVSERCCITEHDLLNKFITLMKLKERKSSDWQVEFELFLLREKPMIKKSLRESKPNQEIEAPRSAVNKSEFWEAPQDFVEKYYSRNTISKGIDNAGIRCASSNQSGSGNVRKATDYLL